MNNNAELNRQHDPHGAISSQGGALPSKSARSITLHLLLQIVIRVGGLLSGLLGVAVLARGLTHDDFGRFFICLSIVGLATALCELGLTSAAVREYSVTRSDPTTVAGALLVGRLLTALIATVGAVVAVGVVFGWASFWWPSLLILGTLLLSPLTTGQAWAQSQLRIGLQNALIMLQSWIWPVGILVVYVTDGGAVEYALAFFISAFVYAVVSFLAFRTGIKSKVRGSSQVLWRLIKVAIPYAIAGMFITAYYRFGGLVLFRTAGPTDSANFSAGFRVIEALQTIPAALLTVVLPLVARTFGDPTPLAPERRQRLYDLAIRASLTVGLAAAVGVSLLSSRIVELLYGRTYSDAGPLLAVLIWSFPPICLGYVAMSTTVASGKTRPLMLITGLIGIGNLVLCVALIPSHGTVAAAGITVATEWLVAAAVMLWLARGVDLRFPLTSFIRIAAAAIAMGLALMPLRAAPLSVSVPIGAIVFGVAALGFRGIDRQDLRLLLQRDRATSKDLAPERR